jgi:lysophospholipase L1-like esterase
MKHLLFFLSLSMLLIASARGQPFGDKNTNVQMRGGLTADSLMLPPLYADTPTSARVRVNGSLVRVVKSGDTGLYQYIGVHWIKVGTTSIPSLLQVTTAGDSTTKRVIAGNGNIFTPLGMLVVFGNSVAARTGATTVANSFVNQAAAINNLTLKLHAHAGATMQHGTPHNTNGDMEDSLSHMEYATSIYDQVVFEFTFNDLCAHANDTNYNTTNVLISANNGIDTALAHGFAKNHITFLTAWYSDSTKMISSAACGNTYIEQRRRDYVNAILSLKSLGVNVVNIYNPFLYNFSSGYIYTDNFHPNDNGHREIAYDLSEVMGSKIISYGPLATTQGLYSATTNQALLTSDSVGNVYIEHGLGIKISPLYNTYINTPISSAMSSKFGALEMLSFSINNNELTNNLYYNGGNKYRAAGYGTSVNFQAGGIALSGTPATGTADASAAVNVIARFRVDGGFGLGSSGNFGNSSAFDISGAYLKCLPNGHISIATSTDTTDKGVSFYNAGLTILNNTLQLNTVNTYASGGYTYPVYNSTSFKIEKRTTIPINDITGVVYGSSTQSGDGSTTTFNIAHGLGTTPTYWDVVAASSAGAGITYITADATNLIVHYTLPPASGTNNLIFKYTAK